eukprot:938348-Alexandrium_andersonii.AAC.1
MNKGLSAERPLFAETLSKLRGGVGGLPLLVRGTVLRAGAPAWPQLSRRARPGSDAWPEYCSWSGPQ